jgi:hypothetical protein
MEDCAFAEVDFGGGEVDFGKQIGGVELYLGCLVELRCFALCRGGILLVVQ